MESLFRTYEEQMSFEKDLSLLIEKKKIPTDRKVETILKMIRENIEGI